MTTTAHAMPTVSVRISAGLADAVLIVALGVAVRALSDLGLLAPRITLPL